MPSAAVPDYLPSKHGFPFPNWYPPGTPVLELPTPFGTIPIGNANGGLCGGMAFASLDLFRFDQRPPSAPDPPVFRYLCHRLIDSFNLPFGVLKYYDWQCRPLETRTFGGVVVQDGLTRLTVEFEWPKIRMLLDAEQPVALGLVKAHSFNPIELGKNHQVLAYAYELIDATGDLLLKVYDPNYPGDDGVTLSLNVNEPSAGRAVNHNREGQVVRGVFATEYRAPAGLPTFEPASRTPSGVG